MVTAPYALLALRLLLGWMYFYAGLVKLLDPEWSAAGYLKTAQGPFANAFQSMAGSQVVDALVMWGLLLIGLALMLGFLTRAAAFLGVVITLLFYFSKFPPQYGLVDEHIIYVAAFIVVGYTGVGKFFGVDGSPSVRKLAERNNRLRLLTA